MPQTRSVAIRTGGPKIAAGAPIRRSRSLANSCRPLADQIAAAANPPSAKKTGIAQLIVDQTTASKANDRDRS